MKKILLLILFLINSCGYQPIYKVDQKLNNKLIKEVEFFGNEKINKKIFSSLPFKISSKNEKLDKLVLDSKIRPLKHQKTQRS